MTQANSDQSTTACPRRKTLEKGKQARQRFIRFSGFLSLLLLILFLISWFSVRSGNNHGIATGLNHAREALKVVSKNLSARLSAREKQVLSLADTLKARSTEMDINALNEVMRRFFYAGPGTEEVGMALRPYYLGPQQRLFGWKMTSTNQGLAATRLDTELDYTLDKAGWYQQGILATTGKWLQPNFDRQLKRTFATYVLPIFESNDKTGEVIGVIYLKLALDRLQDVLEQLPVDNHSRAFLLAEDLTFLLHPNYDFLAQKLRYDEIYPDTHKLRKVMLGQGSIAIRAYDTGLDTYHLFEPIRNGWRLGASIARIDLLPEHNVRRSQHINCFLLLMLSLLFSGIMTARIYLRGTTYLWGVSLLVAGNFVLMIVFVMFQAMRHVDDSSDLKRPITTPKVVRQFKHDYIRASLKDSQNLPVFIPTGVYVQSVSFISSREILMTGYIWQRYDNKVHKGIERGFVMPENEEADIKKAYTRVEGDLETVGWRFRVKLNQRFDYSKYPLGMENIWVQLWHKDFAKNVVLVPDLNSYKLSEPFVMPGIKQGLELPSWRVLETFFSYQPTTYRTDFGLGDYSGLTEFPELYFNIRLRKNLLGPAVSHLLPTTVVLIMLFSVLLLSSREDQKMSLFGFDAMSVIGSCSGLFLAVVFAHIGLRDSLAVKGIVYLEHFYFATYALILWVAVNSLLFTKLDNKIVRYRENLISQLSYWPVSQGYILLVTLIDFY